MLQDDLDRLAKAPVDRSLSGLESAIWHNIAARMAEQRRYRSTFAAQMAILAVATVWSLAAGHQWAAAHEAQASAGALSPYTRLAASTLLMGDSR